MTKRFKEEEIVKILKEADTIGNVREVIWKYNIFEQSFYRKLLPMVPKIWWHTNL